MATTALITNDAVVLGLLAVTLGVIFATTHSQARFWRRFYAVVPALLLCYFIPGLYNSVGLIDGEHSQLYPVFSRYLLPACLVLFTLAIDLPAILKLGPKVLVMFLTGTASVIIGAPLALWLVLAFAPQILGSDAEQLWRGLTAIAGSWIGGGANQAAMKEVFAVPDNLFAKMVTVDVLVANIWMAVLLVLAARAPQLDAKRGADTRSLEQLKQQMTLEAEASSRPLSHYELMLLAALALGATGLSHLLAQPLVALFGQWPWAVRLSLDSSFFWIVVLATSFGLLLSFTRARQLEGAGASKLGSLLLYLLVASIGMKIDVRALLDVPGYFVVGLLWMSFHAAAMLLMAKLLKAPLFYMAVGSQANIGGAASAPVVAAAFHPALAPVGVVLAVLGYALGTYGGWIAGQLMRLASGQ